jgi:hypothetical protein
VRDLRSAYVAIGAVSVAVLAGCSSSGSDQPATSPTSPSTSPSGSPAAAGSLCARLAAPLRRATGVSWPTPQQVDNGPVHQCQFPLTDGHLMTVQIADGESHAGFADNRALVVNAGGPVQKVESLGDEAYSQTNGATAFVAARQGDVGVSVQLQGGTTNLAEAAVRAAFAVLAT